MNQVRMRRGKRQIHGFSLIEVLIALLVLAFGLLGFALLQTMSLRFAQSANYRTQATNLAYELLDQMRGNRLLAAQYIAASFASGDGAPCATPQIGNITIAGNIARWKCEVRTTLGEGSGAVIAFDPASGVAQVDITWGDERWNDADNNGEVTAAESNQKFSVRTRL